MSEVTTRTATANGSFHLTADKGLPNRLGNRFKDYAKLNRAQAGHIRHFHNLLNKWLEL